jgi:hypothetical protein
MLREQCSYGVECHSLEVDPRFAAPDKGDFRFLPGSPALKLGIQPVAPPPIDRKVFPFSAN